MPKVSVIIPTHNRPDLIKRAIRSVLTQTFQDFEIIVVDDGLQARAEKIVAEFSDSRIKYIAHDREKGGAAARNTGIRQATGEFIAFLDDDDEWLPEKLEKQVKALEASPFSVGVVFCGVGLYGAKGELLNERIYAHQGIVAPFKDLLHKCFIWTSALMLRRELKEKGGYFDADFKKNQEWDLELRLAKLTDFYSIEEPLAKINILGEREHMGGEKNIDNIISGFETLVRKHYPDYLKQKKSLALRYFQLANLYFRKDDFEKMQHYLYLSWRNEPINFVYFSHLAASFLGKKVYSLLRDSNNASV